jgi:prepilin-type N-terminal cleavage/methylation domain-containing protein
MKNLKVSNKKGFSLVELLVVIAVIGVIAAIAIPAMSGIFGQSRETKNRRNAQSLVSTFNAALAAGVAGMPALTGTKADDAQDIVTFFSTPRSGTGVMGDSIFHIDMEAGEVTAALPYLQSEAAGTGYVLTYTAGGDS